jgi:hypothetical protein
MIRRIAYVALLAALAIPVPAGANTLNGNGMVNRWKASDRCAAAAQKANPDFTAESNAKRDRATKDCLAGQMLPPRESLDPK